LANTDTVTEILNHGKERGKTLDAHW